MATFDITTTVESDDSMENIFSDFHKALFVGDFDAQGVTIEEIYPDEVTEDGPTFSQYTADGLGGVTVEELRIATRLLGDGYHG